MKYAASDNIPQREGSHLAPFPGSSGVSVPLGVKALAIYPFPGVTVYPPCLQLPNITHHHKPPGIL